MKSLWNFCFVQAVKILDRFLAKRSVSRSKLQLVGCASMFIAAKYEEISPPEVFLFLGFTPQKYMCKYFFCASSSRSLSMYATGPSRSHKCWRWKSNIIIIGKFVTAHWWYRYIVNTLGFQFTSPTPLYFADSFLHQYGSGATSEVRNLTYYFLELTLQDFQFVRYLPSTCAASALYLAIAVDRSSEAVCECLLIMNTYR